MPTQGSGKAALDKTSTDLVNLFVEDAACVNRYSDSVHI